MAGDKAQYHMCGEKVLQSVWTRWQEECVSTYEGLQCSLTVLFSVSPLWRELLPVLLHCAVRSTARRGVKCRVTLITEPLCVSWSNSYATLVTSDAYGCFYFACCFWEMWKRFRSWLYHQDSEVHKKAGVYSIDNIVRCVLNHNTVSLTLWKATEFPHDYKGFRGVGKDRLMLSLWRLVFLNIAFNVWFSQQILIFT